MLAAQAQQQSRLEAEVVRVARDLASGTAAVSLGVETPLMDAGVDSNAATQLSAQLRAFTRRVTHPCNPGALRPRMGLQSRGRRA